MHLLPPDTSIDETNIMASLPTPKPFEIKMTAEEINDLFGELKINPENGKTSMIIYLAEEHTTLQNGKKKKTHDKHTKRRPGKITGEERNRKRGDSNQKNRNPANPNKRQKGSSFFEGTCLEKSYVNPDEFKKGVKALGLGVAAAGLAVGAVVTGVLTP